MAINVTANVTPIAVIQVKPGIGDVVWHLPFIRAIAAAAPERQVTFFAPPTSAATDLLAAERCVAATVYFEHAGSELQRGINLLRLVALLRRYRLQSIWILDRTIRPGTRRGTRWHSRADRAWAWPAELFHHQSRDRSGALSRSSDRLATRLDGGDECTPALDRAGPAVVDKSADHGWRKVCTVPPPWAAIGIGASHPEKDWPDNSWREFLRGLQTPGTVFLVGGPANEARAEQFVAASGSGQIVNACALPLIEAAALLRLADLFVVPSSGPLNLAAAGGTDAFGLFGSTPVLTYSKFIHAIVPEGGPSAGGMTRIAPAQVLERIAPSLSRRKMQPRR